MRKLATRQGEIKAERTPFLRFFTDDWLAGTLGMGFEEKGFYLELLIRMWDRKDGLPNDDRWLATSLQCNPRTVRKLRASLIASGKLEIRDGKLINPRMMRDIESHSPKHHSEPIGDEFEPNSSPIQLELEPNKPKKSMITTRVRVRVFHIPYSRKKERITAAASHLEPARPSEPVAALPEKVDLKDLSNKLIEACNGSLDNPVNCLGLLNLSTPQMWLANGCDLEADVLPTLRAAGQKYHGKRIRDWSYFTGMIAEAKAKRTSKLPEVPACERRPPPAFQTDRSARSAKVMALLNLPKATP